MSSWPIAIPTKPNAVGNSLEMEQQSFLKKRRNLEPERALRFGSLSRYHQYLHEPQDEIDTTDSSDENYEDLNSHESFEISVPPREEIPVDSKRTDISFLLDLAVAYHTYGAPTNHIEMLMTECCERLQIPSSWSVLSTVLMVTFGDPAKKEAISLSIRNEQQFGPWSKFHDTQLLIEKVINDEIDLVSARESLNKIIKSPLEYNKFYQLCAISVAGFVGCLLFFNGGLFDAIVSFFLAMVVGFFHWIGEKNLHIAYFGTLISALFASSVATLISAYYRGACYSAIVVSALLWELPGIPITLAIHELATKNIITGTARMFYGLMISLQLGYGVAVGASLPFWTNPDFDMECTPSFSEEWNILWAIIITISFNILMDNKLQNWPGIFLTTAVGYGTHIGLSKTKQFGSDSLAFIAAFTLTVCANILSRFKRNSSILFMISGLLLLVPGTLSLKGAVKMVKNDITAGVSITAEMVTVAMSLTVGALIAKAIVRPREVLQYS